MKNFIVIKRILVMLCTVAVCFSVTAQTEYVETWDPDADGDGLIGVSDLLALLGVFQEEDMDNDGIWDSQDDCVGEYDACGVCNGEGIPCPCSSPVSFDGFEYEVIQIGNQCWIAENLRTEHYANGDAIPANFSESEWASTTSGAVAVYGEDLGCVNYAPDGDACDPAWSLNEYGRLYNWYAVDDTRGLCPSGWHVPTDGEWMALELELGMSLSQANSTGWRGTDQGTQMKTTHGWYGGDNGTNSSGFSGLPGGWRAAGGDAFENAGYSGHWWSSSSSGFNAWYRSLYRDESSVYRNTTNQNYGFSVRCVQD